MDYERAMEIRARRRARERKLSSGNWECSVGAVNCMNERHKIIVTRKGRLVLPNHKGQSIEEISAMLVFNPEVRCRCIEVKKIWKWYTAVVTPNFYSLRDEESWITEIFVDTNGYFTTPSDSKLLSCLPAGIRSTAEFHRRAGDTRKSRYQPWVPPIPAHRRLVGGSRKNLRKDISLRRFQRILATDPTIKRRAENNGKMPTGFNLGYAVQKALETGTPFFSRPWFRAIADRGVYPGELPPSFMWDVDGKGRDYPTILKAWATTGVPSHGEYGEFRVKEIWVKVRWSDLSNKYEIEREQFMPPEGQ